MHNHTFLPAVYLLAASLVLLACSTEDTSGDRSDAPTTEDAEDTAVLFTYFKGNGESGVFL